MAQPQRVIQLGNDKIDSIETMKFSSFGEDIGFPDSELDQDIPDIPDMEEQANILLQQAEIEAENTISKAKSEAERIKKEAYQIGYDGGQKTANTELNKTVVKLTKLFTNMTNEIGIVRDEIIGNAESDIIELTLTIAEKLACRELKQNQDFIIDVIKEAIKTAKNGNDMTLKINPSDRAILEKNANEIIELARSATFNPNLRLMIEDDQNINQGDCVVVTDKNIFDMTFKSRLDSIIETINLQRTQAINKE